MRVGSEACPDEQFILEGQQEIQMGKGATKRTSLAQPSTVTWDLGIPQEFLPAPHLSYYNLLLLSPLFSLALNSSSLSPLKSPGCYGNSVAEKKAEFWEVLRHQSQQALLRYSFVQVLETLITT